MSGLYLGPHICQLDAQWSARTNSSGCTWTSTAMGIGNVTHGERRPGPDKVHSLVRAGEETNPGTPGWSIPDVDLAMRRFGLPFRNLTGGRWDGVRFEHEHGRYVILQGDSDQFGNNTCSGKFDGDHCIGIHPDSRAGDRGQEWRIDDPICKASRWELASTIRRYAEDLDVLCRYGSFSDEVPDKDDPILRFGAKSLGKPTPKKIHVGQPPIQAIVRRRPTTESANLATKPSGSIFVAYQVTREGQKLDGSRVWYGNRRGRRWLHESAF